MKKTLLLCLLMLGGRLAATAETWQELRHGPWLFVFEESDRWAADRLVSFADAVYDTITAELHWRPAEVKVVLRGRTDLANGFYGSAPDRIDLFLPVPDSKLISARLQDYLRTLLTHEFTHFVHLAAPRGLFGALSPVFGNFVLSANQLFLPGWMVEGITTNLEGLNNGGGRDSNPFFEMTWKAPLLEGRPWTYEQAGYASYAVPAGRIYTSGFFLVRYLREKWGDQAFIQTYDNYAAWSLFGFDGALKQTTGLEPAQFFQQAVQAQTARYAADRALPSGQDLSPGPGFHYLPRLTRAGWIGYVEADDHQPGLYRLGQAATPDWSQSQAWHPVNLASESDWTVDASCQTIVVALADTTNQRTTPGAFTARRDLWQLTGEQGSWRRVTTDGGWAEPALAPDGQTLAALKLDQGKMSLVVGPNPASAANQTFHGERLLTSDRLETPAFSPDGHRLAVINAEAGQQGITVLHRQSQTWAIEKKLRLERGALYNPRWAGSDRLWLTTDAQGRLDPVQFDLATDQFGLWPLDPVGVIEGEALADGQWLYATATSLGQTVKLYRWAEPVGRPLPAVEVQPAPATTPPPSTEASRPYWDLPQAWGWLPAAAVNGFQGMTSWGAGINLYGASLLDTQSWWLQGLYHPDLQAVSVSGKYGWRGDGYQGSLSGYRLAESWGSDLAATLRLNLPLLEADTPDFVSGLEGQLASSFFDQQVGQVDFRYLAELVGLNTYLYDRNRSSRAFFGSSGVSLGGSLSLFPAALSLDHTELDAVLNLDLNQALPLDGLLTLGADLYRTTGPGLLRAPRGRSFGPASPQPGDVRLHLAGDLKIPLGLAEISTLGLVQIREGLGLWFETGAQGFVSSLGLDPAFFVGVEYSTSLIAGAARSPLHLGVGLRRDWSAPWASPRFPQDFQIQVGAGSSSR